MIQRTNSDMLFTDFYEQWITTYKQGAIRPVTMSKYKMAHMGIVRLIPDLKIGRHKPGLPINSCLTTMPPNTSARQRWIFTII